MTNHRYNNDAQAKKQRAKMAFALGTRVIDKEYPDSNFTGGSLFLGQQT
jgi:hypothetical protein